MKEVKMQCLSIMIFGTLFFLECSGHRIIATRHGTVLGKRRYVLGNEIDVFLGITYAEASHEKTRFTLSFPSSKWKEVYNIEKPPTCIQNPPVPKFEWVPDLQNMAEDCLYLNVWVPAKKNDKESFSTMVWIHGGGFNTGSSNMDIYDGGVIASLGNVIVVSINYRLGAFGFLYFGKDYTPGNVAMLDQVFALRWIQENIAAFGGSKDKITLFGQSAGAWSIGTHIVSPLSQGLFNRVILQSGSVYHPSVVVDPGQNILVSTFLASELGCFNDSYQTAIKCMREKSADDISFIEKAITKSKQTLLCFLPQVQIPYLPKDPVKSFDTGEFHRVDVMLGNVIDEGSLFLAAYKEEFLTSDDPAINKIQSKEFLSNILNFNDTLLQPVLKNYLENVSNDDHQAILKQTHKVIGDWIFKCPTNFLAEKLAGHNIKVYHYTFNHSRTKNGHRKWTGVPHFEEVPFIFGVPLQKTKLYTPEENEFSRNLIKLWTSFAKTGNPTDLMSDEWLPFTSDTRNSIELKPGNIKGTKLLEDDNCKFWKTYYPK
ncbi:cholinesterase 1-like [Centruroides sculpturatus]|uniref:cholinesterase 1-like n=1 Tax=Centruroides sculpturatus TaxID=218467 RepID=UPI000C6E3754|nr:cholinesterase 1-like [Centruroides sculpturatus]